MYNQSTVSLDRKSGPRADEIASVGDQSLHMCRQTYSGSLRIIPLQDIPLYKIYPSRWI